MKNTKGKAFPAFGTPFLTTQYLSASCQILTSHKILMIKNHCSATPLVITLLLVILLSGCSKKNTVANENTVPNSIVALSPSAAEILFAVGAGEQVAAVSDFTDYPPEAAEKPIVGGFDGKTLSMEKILSYKPDLVYMSDVMHNYMIEQLNSYGIKYYLSTANSIAGVEKEILDIGEITGHTEQAKKVVLQMEEKIQSLNYPHRNADYQNGNVDYQNENLNYQTGSENYPAGGAPKLYYEVWNVPYMSVGAQSFINDVISAAGAQNIFSDVNDAYPIVSEESIISRQPEIIIIPASSGVSVADIKQRAGWQTIPAVQNNKIYIIDDNIYTRPGPRIADVVQELANIVFF